MTRVSASDLRKDAADMLNRVAYADDRIVVHRREKDVAVIISVKDYELLKKMEDARDIDAIKKSKKVRGKSVKWETLKAECKL